MNAPLSKSEAKKSLSQLESAWRLKDNKIRREFKFNDFKEVITFVNQVAGLAESANHHPNIHIFYNRVMIELWTHAVKGLSKNDFILASKIEKVVH